MVVKTIVIVVGFLMFASFWGFYQSVRPSKFVSNYTPKDFGVDFEDVAFKTEDGLNLRGWLVPAKKETKKTIIVLHGYPADKGDLLPFMIYLAEEFNLLFFDFRYLGGSEGRYSTAGAKETGDLEAAIKFLKSKNINEIGIFGFSMGGAVALMSAPKIPEIKAIVSEASYSSLDRLTPDLYRLPVLRHVLGFLTIVWGKIILGIDAKNVSPAESAKKINIPVLIVHSLDDEVIPFSHALAIKEALSKNQKAEFWFDKGFYHGSLNEDYKTRIRKFFNKNL